MLPRLEHEQNRVYGHITIGECGRIAKIVHVEILIQMIGNLAMKRGILAIPNCALRPPLLKSVLFAVVI